MWIPPSPSVASGKNGDDGIVQAIEDRLIQPWWVFLGTPMFERCLDRYIDCFNKLLIILHVYKCACINGLVYLCCVCVYADRYTEVSVCAPNLRTFAFTNARSFQDLASQ